MKKFNREALYKALPSGIHCNELPLNTRTKYFSPSFRKLFNEGANLFILMDGLLSLNHVEILFQATEFLGKKNKINSKNQKWNCRRSPLAPSVNRTQVTTATTLSSATKLKVPHERFVGWVYYSNKMFTKARETLQKSCACLCFRKVADSVWRPRKVWRHLNVLVFISCMRLIELFEQAGRHCCYFFAKREYRVTYW